jgi:anaerobic selenocysteine-containing dehydrogenase
MRRVGPKGNGRFTRIAWEEAIGTVAARLRDVIAAHGGEAIWSYVGSDNMGLIQGIYGRRRGVSRQPCARRQVGRMRVTDLAVGGSLGCHEE